MRQNFSKVLFIPLVLFILSIAIVSVCSLFIYQNKHISESAKNDFDKISKIIELKIKNDVLNYETFIKLINKDQVAKDLFLNSDREGLYNYFKELYAEFKEKYNISHFYFHKTDQYNFLRVHNKNKHSDFIDRYTLKESIKTKNVGSGIEFGIFHNLTLRVVYPWFDNDNKIIGYIELGKEIDYLTPELASLENCEIIYTIDRKFINKDDYNKWLKHSKNNQNFKELENYFIIDSSLASISKNILLLLNSNKKVENVTVSNGKNIYKVFNKPFYDVSNRKLGNLFILCNMTHEYNFLYSLFKDSTIIILILFIILLIYFYNKLKKTEKNIHKEHQEIFSMSITDSLSKLYNKRYFDTVYESKIKNSKDTNNRLSLLIIDIDNFKKYNDLYGHQEGDEVIKKVALTIKSTFRRASDDCFRVGGEEFAVLTQTRDEIDAEEMCELLRKNIESLNIEHKENENFNKITVSIGVHIINFNEYNPKKIYKKADDALYISKQNGRNQVTIYERPLYNSNI